jgi:hypothetical protein
MHRLIDMKPNWSLIWNYWKPNMVAVFDVGICKKIRSCGKNWFAYFPYILYILFEVLEPS